MRAGRSVGAGTRTAGAAERQTEMVAVAAGVRGVVRLAHSVFSIRMFVFNINDNRWQMRPVVEVRLTRPPVLRKIGMI